MVDVCAGSVAGGQGFLMPLIFHLPIISVPSRLRLQVAVHCGYLSQPKNGPNLLERRTARERQNGQYTPLAGGFEAGRLDSLGLLKRSYP